MSVSTQTASDDQAGESWDELSLVGIPDAIDVQALFDPTGTSRPSESLPLPSVGILTLANCPLNSK